MNKPELLRWYTEEQQKWELILAAIGDKRMIQPGVNGSWSMCDIITHLTGWQWWLIARLQAAIVEQPEPSPPWSNLKNEDEINAWIYEAARNRTVKEVLADTNQAHEAVKELIESLPEDTRYETIESKFHVVWANDQRYAVGEFFHHFYDDHLTDVGAWLARTENL